MLCPSLEVYGSARYVRAACLTLLSILLPIQAVGADFAPIAPKALSSVLIDVERAGTRLVAVGERGHVLYSQDHGASWQQAQMPFRRMLTGVAFADEQRGWAVGHQSMVFHTRDGGATWTRQLDGFALQSRFNQDNLVRTREAFEALSAELGANPDPTRDLELEDALFAYEDAELALEEPPLPTNLHDVWFLDDTSGWAVGAFGRLLETRDGGANWSEIAHRLDNPDGFHLNGITGTPAGEVFIAGEGGVLYRSVDGGQSWESLDSGYMDTFFGIVHEPVHGTLTAFGLGGALYESNDLGLTWQALQGPAEATFAGAAALADGGRIFVGPAGMVLLVDGATGGMQTQLQDDRGNYSTALQIDGDRVLVVGAGGPRVIEIN